VRIGELSLGRTSKGFSRGVTSTTGRFSAAYTGTAYAGGVRVGSKRPNQGVRGLIGPFRERLNWEDD
jgi:hypothetical protein